MSSNYPPGVTGNESQIAGDADWESFYEQTEHDATRHGLEAMEAQLVWSLGLKMFLLMRETGAKWPHEIGRCE